MSGALHVGVKTLQITILNNLVDMELLRIHKSVKVFHFIQMPVLQLQ